MTLTSFDTLTRVLTGLSEYTIRAADDTHNGLEVLYTDEIAARRRTTTRCRELIGLAGKDRSTASVAREFSVSWATAWTAIRHVATRELGRCGRRVPSVIGIDETRFWWREPWLTGIVDLANSDLLEMVCGRSSQTLRDWVYGLTNIEKAGVSTVVIDLHAGYRAAIREVLPHAVIVGDRFHFEQLTGRALTDVRRRRIWEQASHRGRKTEFRFLAPPSGLVMLVAGGESVAGGAGFDDVGFVGEAVDDGGGESGVGEGFGPFGEGGVGGDGDGCSFFSFGEDLEEEFSGFLVEVDVAEFVDGEEVVAGVAVHDA